MCIDSINTKREYFGEYLGDWLIFLYRLVKRWKFTYFECISVKFKININSVNGSKKIFKKKQIDLK